jgi:nucleotide-binding universal stress UspA family protein
MRVLLAVDASPCSDAAVEEVTRRFARADTQVRVVHAVECMKEMPLAYQFGQGSTAGHDAAESRRRSFERAEALVNGIATRLESVGFRQVSVSTPDADPWHGIVDDARAWKADLIVMGSHGRHGLDRMFLGSVAEEVLRHATCSVEIVREPVAAAVSPRP